MNKNTLVAISSATLIVLLIISILFSLAGAHFGEAIEAFFKGAFGGRKFAYLMNTISRTALITGMALSVLISFRAGLINIGGEGQLVLGSLAGAAVGLLVGGSGVIGILITCLAAMLAGASWALVAGVLYLWMGVPLLVGSLLLNYPARFIASYFVSHPLRDVQSGLPQTHLLDKDLWLPFFPSTRLDIGILFILAAYIFTLVYSHRTVHGYYAKLSGISGEFTRTVGLPTKKIALQTLAISGAIAGLVGAIAVLGIQHRFTDGFLVQPLYAWTGVITALLVNLTPWATIVAGFFFAALQSGAAGMERVADVPREIAIIIQATIILFVAGYRNTIKQSDSHDA